MIALVTTGLVLGLGALSIAAGVSAMMAPRPVPVRIKTRRRR